MKPKFINTQLFSTAWKGTKSAIYDISRIINRILYLVFHADSCSRVLHAKFGTRYKTIVNVISVISIIFSLGYMKNIFQALDGEEPQFSAMDNRQRISITYFLASLITGFVVLAGFLFFIIPGIYLALRLQFFQAFIIEEKWNYRVLQKLGEMFMKGASIASVHSGVGNDRDP